MAKEARGDAESCETRCSAERAKAFCWFWKGPQLRTGSAWGLAMADASSAVQSPVEGGMDGWMDGGMRYESQAGWLWKKLARPGSRSVASRVALQSEIRLSRDASLKPCEARRDEMRLDAAGMRRQKRGEQNEEATGWKESE